MRSNGTLISLRDGSRRERAARAVSSSLLRFIGRIIIIIVLVAVFHHLSREGSPQRGVLIIGQSRTDTSKVKEKKTFPRNLRLRERCARTPRREDHERGQLKSRQSLSQMKTLDQLFVDCNLSRAVYIPRCWAAGPAPRHRCCKRWPSPPILLCSWFGGSGVRPAGGSRSHASARACGPPGPPPWRSTKAPCFAGFGSPLWLRAAFALAARTVNR